MASRSRLTGTRTCLYITMLNISFLPAASANEPACRLRCPPNGLACIHGPDHRFAISIAFRFPVRQARLPAWLSARPMSPAHPSVRDRVGRSALERVPRHRVVADQLFELLPKVLVYDSLPAGVLPSVALPSRQELSDSATHVVGVCQDCDLAGSLENLQPLDCSSQFHSIVRRVRHSSLQHALMFAAAKDARPTSRTGISRHEPSMMISTSRSSRAETVDTQHLLSQVMSALRCTGRRGQRCRVNASRYGHRLRRVVLEFGTQRFDCARSQWAARAWTSQSCFSYQTSTHDNAERHDAAWPRRVSNFKTVQSRRRQLAQP